MKSAFNAPHLSNEEAAIAYVEGQLWPDGPGWRNLRSPVDEIETAAATVPDLALQNRTDLSSTSLQVAEARSEWSLASPPKRQ